MLSTLFFGFFKFLWYSVRWVLLFLFRPMSLFSDGKDDSARWMSQSEKKRNLHRKHKGFLIDGKNLRLSLEQSYRNVLVVGNTGSGKSQSLILPNIHTLKTNAIILDVSGELYEKSSLDLAKRRYTVERFDLSDVTNSTVRYNPLKRAFTSSKATRQFIKTLLGAAYGLENTKDQFWILGASNVLHLLCNLLKKEDEQYQNLANLHHLLVNLSGKDSPTERYILKNANDKEYQTYKNFMADAKVSQSFISTAIQALESINDEDIAELTASDTFNFKRLREEKTVLFLCCKESEIVNLSVILSLFFSQMYEELMVLPKRGERYEPILVFLDEAATLKGLNMPRVMTQTRKFAIGNMVVVQNEQQIHEQFPKSGTTLIEGAIANKVYLPGITNLNQLRNLESLIGFENTATGRRPLLSVNAIKNLNHELLLFLGAMPALKTKMHYSFNNRKWQRRSGALHLPVAPIDSLTYLSLPHAD